MRARPGPPVRPSPPLAAGPAAAASGLLCALWPLPCPRPGLAGGARPPAPRPDPQRGPRLEGGGPSVVRRGFIPAPRSGPPGARPGGGARWLLCPPLPRVWCRGPWWCPLWCSGAPWLSRLAPGGPRASVGRASPTPLRAAWCPGGLVGRAGGPVPRPVVGDVGKTDNYTPGRKGEINGPPIGPGGRPCPRGWLLLRGAVLPWCPGRGAGPPCPLVLRCPGRLPCRPGGWGRGALPPPEDHRQGSRQAAPGGAGGRP